MGHPDHRSFFLYANDKGMVECGVGWSPTEYRILREGCVLPEAAWTHIAATWDGATHRMPVRTAPRRRRSCALAALVLATAIAAVLVVRRGSQSPESVSVPADGTRTVDEAGTGLPPSSPGDPGTWGPPNPHPPPSQSDFPVGDPVQIRRLLAEHVAAPARRPAALPPPGEGP